MNAIYNFLSYHDKLFSSGMPTLEQLKKVAEAGIQVVINLATSKSEGAIQNEAELVAGLGMKYIHIPVEWDNPTKQNLEDFFCAMKTHNNDKILVHCQANFRATGFVMLYRVLQLGWKQEDAFQSVWEIWDPKEYPVWQKFLDDRLKEKRG